MMILISMSQRLSLTLQKFSFGVGLVMSSQAMLALCCTAFAGL